MNDSTIAPKPVCANCIYYRGENNLSADTVGECRRHSTRHKHKSGHFPSTFHNIWCGEWRGWNAPYYTSDDLVLETFAERISRLKTDL